MTILDTLRQEYHRKLCRHVIYMERRDIPSMADGDSDVSVAVAQALVKRLGYPIPSNEIKSHTPGTSFEEITKDYIQQAFALLAHVRPGQWRFSVLGDPACDQYQQLAEFSKLMKSRRELRTALGEYVIKPDIAVGRAPLTDAQINTRLPLVKEDGVPRYTLLRAANRPSPRPILHASISCKWTLRSDRSQNARTEGLNLMRNRKGNTPHIAIITAEPLPGRIASLALGTGDLDCVYHFALHELMEVVSELYKDTLLDMLQIMVDGRRLRDIADLPFDLSI